MVFNMSPDTIVIYSTPGCGWAVRNYAALIEKNIPFTVVMAKDPEGRKTEAFRSLSPYDRTPVLSLDGNIVWDSLHMNCFIDEVFPDPALMPNSSIERERARLWMRHCEHELFPLIINNNGKLTAASAALMWDGLRQLTEYGFPTEHSGRFWMGSRLGLVDLCYSTLFYSLDMISTNAQPGWLDIPARLLRWRDEIYRHPTMRRALSIQEKLSLDRPSLIVSPSEEEKVGSDRQA